MMKETKEKSAIFQSGILRNDPSMARFLAGGGETVQLPFWKDIKGASSGNVASDDPSDDATPQKITTGKDIARRQVRTEGWSVMQLTAELAGDDPMRRIAGRISNYWVGHFQDMLVATLTGVFADNTANDSSDMVHDISIDTTATLTDAELISEAAVIDAALTMGDAMRDLNTIIMHSVVFARLQKQQVIDYIPGHRSEIMFPTYLGKRVIVDDGSKVVTGTNKTMYHTYLVGSDALCWAEHPVAKPIETDHDASVGGGMGDEEIWSRQQFLLHPYGIKFTDSSVAGNFPTDAELAAAANWDRVYAERKQIPLALLVTNG